MTHKTRLTVAALIGLAALAAQAQPVAREGVLADAAGRTVYTFDKDEAGISRCAGSCLVAWPAFVARPGAVPQGEFGLIEANGARQWAVNGKPLYYFAGDQKAGDRKGDGSGGVWHVVRAAGATGAAAPASAPASAPRY